MATQEISELCCSKSTQRLFDAIRNAEKEETIEALLQECDDIDARDSKGYTPLLLACSKDKKLIVDLLIKSGANVNVCDRDENTVLHYAIENDWTVTVKYLVKKVLDVNARNNTDGTPLHLASRLGRLEIVKWLLKEGADIERKNLANFTPLLCCAQSAFIHVFDFLKSITNVDGNERLLLYFASLNQWTETIRSLVEKVPDMNERYMIGETDFNARSSGGHLELVKCLVEGGTELNTRMIIQAALHKASSWGHIEVVKWIVKKGAEMQRILNIDLKVHGDTALFSASSQGHLKVVKCLVEEGADINARNNIGWTVLQVAFGGDHLETVKYLLEKGAKFNTGVNDRLTLLHCASENGWLEVVMYLVKRGCNLDAKQSKGMTALAIACWHKKLNIVEYLLQAGACWDTADKNGNSPLNYLTRKETPDYKFVKLFIESGAYLKPIDYEAIVRSSSLKVLQDVKLCSNEIINHFNNHDLPELYKLPSSQILPRIQKLKIASCSKVAQAIEQTVRFEIQTKGYCNILDEHPRALSILSVRSFLEYDKKKKLELKKQLKRPAAFDSENKYQHSSKSIRLR